MTDIYSWHPDDEVILWGVNVLLQVTIVSMIALLAARCGRWNAAARYRIFLCCLFLVLFSPAIALVTQASGLSFFSVPMLQEQSVAEVKDTLIEEVPTSPSVRPVEELFSQMGSEPSVRDKSSVVVLPGSSEADVPPAGHTPRILVSEEPVGNASIRESERERPTSAFAWRRVVRIAMNGMFALWLVGAVLYMLRMFRGLWKLLSILRNTRPIDIECLDDVVDDVCRASRTSRMPRLVSSPNVTSPVAAGILHPQIILPEGICNQLTPGDLRSVLIHEMAHIDRRDPLLALLQTLAAAIYWPHPLVRLVNRNLARAREEICDNHVLATTDAPSYGRTLLRLAELARGADMLPASVGLLTSHWKLEVRVADILNDRRSKMTQISTRGTVLIVLISMLSAVAAAATTITAASVDIPEAETQARSGEDVNVTSDAALDGDDPQSHDQPSDLDRKTDAPGAKKRSMPLKDAVVAMNEKARMTFEEMEKRRARSVELKRRYPSKKMERPTPLTVDEIVNAIRAGKPEKTKAAYPIYQKIADTKILPADAGLEFNSQWHHADEQDKDEYLEWRTSLTVMTSKNTGYTLRIRVQKIDSRVALTPSPGYTWIVNPNRFLPVSGRYSFGETMFTIDEDKENAIVVTAAWMGQTKMQDLRMVAFDADANRFNLSSRGVGAHSNGQTSLIMARFRLNPDDLPRDKIKYLGLEGVSPIDRSTTGSRLKPKPADVKEPARKEEKTTALIRVSGHASNQAGTPVAGAKIHLVSTNGIRKKLGETTTDADGLYDFRDVPLPVRKPRNGMPQGTLQVFGEAEGFGIAWHGARSYLHHPRPPESPRHDQDHTIFQDEPIEMDLTFRAAATLAGSVTDDNGLPVTDAWISLSSLDYLDTEGKVFHHNFREFWAMYFAPLRYRVARTGTDGRFEVNGLPRETVVAVRVRHPDFAKRTFYAAITDKRITDYRFISNNSATITNGNRVNRPIWDTRAVKTGPLDVRMRSTRRVVVNVVHEDDELPAKNIRIFASTGNFSNSTSSQSTTDEQGQAELMLPPGEYRLRARPPRGMGFIETYNELTVQAEPHEQSCDVRLQGGCILILKAVDAADGSAIPGVSFWHDVGKGPGRVGVQSSTSYIDHPVTDEKGELRAVVLPGTRHYGVGFSVLPNGYRADPKSDRQLVECQAGKTVRIQFELRK